MKKINAWYQLAFRIIVLFVTAMIVTFCTESLRGFFGDIPNIPSYGHYWGGGFMEEKWNWGVRHYLYFWMCVTLFIVEAVRICMWICDNSEEF